MIKKIKADIEFEEWIKNKQRETGGLINQPTAGKILGKSYKTINGYINRKKVKTYKYDDSTKQYLSLNEIICIAKEQKNQ